MILRKKIILLLSVMALFFFSTSCKEHKGAIAYQIVAAFDEFGPRAAGSPAEAQAAQYLAKGFQWMGYHPRLQSFTATVETDQGQETVASANVIAEKRGDSKRVLIVGAHYDSVDAGRGTDDNASGVAVLCEVAARVREVRTPYTIRFILFGGEELGELGSGYYVDHLSPAEKRNIVAMINLDSVLVGDYTYIYGDFGSQGKIRDWALAWASRHGYDLQTQDGENPDYPAGTTGDWSDHAPFEKAGIPYAYFEATNWTLGDKDGYIQVDPIYGEDGAIWHTPYDNLNYITQTFPGRAEHHLNLFVNVLKAILVEYR